MIPQDYFARVRTHFKGDDKKAWDWFMTIHPNFGMFTPLNMIKLGKGEQVKQYIDRSIKNYTSL